MSILESFIHDPLVEWDSKKDKKRTIQAETEHSKALQIIQVIDNRLQGKDVEGLPLSVEGQVSLQIEAASSLDNLGLMYVGWAAFY